MNPNPEQPKRPRGRPRKPKPEDPALPKRPRGCPPKGDDAKILGFTVKLTRKEMDAWRKLAEHRGMTLGQYILEPHRKGRI